MWPSSKCASGAPRLLYLWLASSLLAVTQAATIAQPAPPSSSSAEALLKIILDSWIVRLAAFAFAVRVSLSVIVRVHNTVVAAQIALEEGGQIVENEHGVLDIVVGHEKGVE